MSDNPYERDNPYEPDPVPTAGPGPETTPQGDEPQAEPAAADDTRTTRLDTADDATAGPPVAPPVTEGDVSSHAPGASDDAAETQRIDTAGAAQARPSGDDAGTDAGDRDDTTPHGSEDAAAARTPDGAVTSTFDVREARRDRLSGSHEAERPVPRSGLTEHSSARYLTGDGPVEADTDREEPARDGTEASQDSGAAAPWLATGAAGGAAARGGSTRADAGASADDDDATGRGQRRAERDVVLDGTTALTRPPSRTGAHAWAVLVSLLLTPVAWYLLADAGARLTLPQGAPWDTGNLNVAALLELGGGLLVLAIVLLAARWSSLGAIITGSLVLIVGVPFVAVPAWTQELLEPVVTWLDDLGDFGRNVAHHLEASGSTGRLVVYGLALILVGVVSHGARRQGRREVRPVVEA